MIHLRIFLPADRSEQVLDLLTRNESVTNVVHLAGAARAPVGDVVLADVAREDASVVLSDLRELRVDKDGSITLEDIDAALSERVERAVEKARGAPSDAVVWEEVEARTSETTELSGSFLAFLVIAALISGIGIYLDSPILIIGGMVVGPEFGPMAALCVAVTQLRRDLAWRSALALLVGFPAAIVCVWLAMLILKETGITASTLDDGGSLAGVISDPDFLSFLVAALAGAAGILSLSTAKSGALIGVLISVTTIPAASNIGLAAVYGNWASCRGSIAQLLLNLGAILLAGTLTLFIQRRLYVHRRRKHLHDPARATAGLPLGRSARS